MSWYSKRTTAFSAHPTAKDPTTRASLMGERIDPTRDASECRGDSALTVAELEPRTDPFALISRANLRKPLERLVDWRIWLSILLLLASAFLWAFIATQLMSVGFLEFLDRERPIDPTFLWGYVAIVLGVGITSWLNDTVKLFMRKLEAFNVCTDLVETFVTRICTHRVDSGLHGAAKARIPDDEWRRMRDLMRILVNTTKYLFLDDPTHMYKPRAMGPRNDLASLCKNYASCVAIASFYESPERACKEVLEHVDILVQRWAVAGLVVGMDGRLLFTDNYRTQIIEIKNIELTQSYAVYKYLLAALISLHLFILPFVMWPLLGDATMFYYPVVAVTFLAIACHNIWIGDPFEGVHSTTYDYLHTERALYRIIDVRFGQFLPEQQPQTPTPAR